MINPKTIGNELVATLLTLPNLMGLLANNQGAIQYYSENAVVFGRQMQSSIRLGILAMPPGSIMVTWQGDAPVRFSNGVWHFEHRYLLMCACRKIPAFAMKISGPRS